MIDNAISPWIAKEHFERRFEVKNEYADKR
jgi:hypothetical protein